MSEIKKQGTGDGAPRRASSFCVPRAAIEALLDARANAYEICAYLVLAAFTDPTGQFSTASVTAVNRRTGANKVKGGPVSRAIDRLLTIRATRHTKVSNGRAGKSHALLDHEEDLGPILINRVAWSEAHPDRHLPDGPGERAQVRHVLPDFGEGVADRVWIGKALVEGIGEFRQPLKALKNAGDVAARLLLWLYAHDDMETWGGVNPHKGPWVLYELNKEEPIPLPGAAQLLRVSQGSQATKIDERVSGGSDAAYWQALEALKAAGLIYEMVTALNRAPVLKTFKNGGAYNGIADDAEPLYELDCRSQHGYKPAGEEGLASVTARTAGDLGHPVANVDGRFWGYAAIVPNGHGCHVVGIYRLRFRVTNPRNAGTKGAWARIQQNNRDALKLVNGVRAAGKLTPLPAPWGRAQEARAAAAQEQVDDPAADWGIL